MTKLDTQIGSAGVFSRDPGWRDNIDEAWLSFSNISKPMTDLAKIPNWGKACNKITTQKM